MKVTVDTRGPGGGWRYTFGMRIGGRTLLLEFGRRSLRITR